jgi:clan AA aspartic protease (TIGR02281 family)
MRLSARAIVVVLTVFLTIGNAVADLDDEGRAAYMRGDYVAAERAFNAAIARSPANPLLRYHRAASLTQLGRWDEAVVEYEYVLKLRPSDDVAAASRGALNNLRSLTAPAKRGAADGEGTIRLEPWGGGWVAEVVVNNTARGRFLVDTGASVTAISRELADNLGIVAGRPPLILRLHTMAGEVKAPVVSISLLRLGSVEAKDVPAVVHDIPGGLDGILGNTFLGRYSVTLNARQGLLTVRTR